MDVITSVIAVIAIFSAIIYRITGESKIERKRVRLAKRTNLKVWSRAERDWIRK